jgi:hypothetical protein
MAETGSSTPDTAPRGDPGDGRQTGLDYRRFAGRVLFPRSPADLTNTAQCPACYTVLVGPVCRVCQLDVSHPATAQVASLSRDAAALLDSRLELIGRIRYDTGQPLRAAAAAIQARDVATEVGEDPFTVFVPVSLPSPARTGQTTPPAAAAPPEVTDATAAAVPKPPRRSSVQVILLIVGISLLSVAAIFFLVYAFINFGILGRSLIIAAVTIASFAIASGLRRRSLTATAEGIAVLAVVLVYLDAFAIRANDFFGLGGVNGAAFWGAALLVTAAGFLAWHRLSGLRTPNIVGFGAIVPGVALVVGGVNEAADNGSRVFLAFAAAALAGVVHHATARPATATRPAFAGRAERLLALGFTGIALGGAFLTAMVVTPRLPWASTGAYLVVAALCTLHACTLHAWALHAGALHAGLVGSRSRASASPVAAVFAGIGGVSAAISVASGAVRFGDLNTIVVAAPVVAVFVALGLELLWRRSSRATDAAASRRRNWLVATIAAATVAAVALVIPLTVAVWSTATVVSRAVSSSWTLAPQDELAHPSTIAGLAVGELALCSLMLTVAWAVSGTRRRLATVCVWTGAAVLVVAVPLLTALAAVFAGWLVLAMAALGALLWMRRKALAPLLRAPLIVLITVSGAFGYLVGWGSTSTWWIGSIVAVALLLIGRMLPASPLGRATALGAAAIVVLVAAAAAARQLALPGLPNPAADADNALRFVSIVAIVLVALSAFRLHARESSLDRQVVFWIGGTAAAVSVGILALSVGSLSSGSLSSVERMSLLLPEPGASLAANLGLLAALLIVVTRPLASRLPVERIVASVVLAPVLSLAVDAFARVIGLPELVRSVGPVTAALLAAVGVLGAASLRARKATGLDTEARSGVLGEDRRPRELGILLVATPSLIIGVARHDSVSWLVLVIAALVALILATSPDGLVGSASPRRHLGWVALALATAGLWSRLGDSRITALEPYVLPLSGLLLLVALFVWRADRQAAGTAPGPVAPVITLAALLVAILPLAATAADGPLARALVVGAVSAASAILGSTAIGTSRSRPYLDSVALAGALGVLTIMIGRSASVSSQGGAPDLRLDAWCGAGLVVLLVAAFGQARHRNDHSEAWRSITSQVLGVLGLAVVLGFELAAFEHTALGELRALAVILLFSAVHVIAFLLDHSPFTRALGWIAIAGAAVAVLGALITGALDTVELGTVPVAVALVITGSLSLSRVSTARTWPWLAPGVTVLLIPSLIATADHPPVFRLVGLGIVGVAIIVASAILRLQAPFLIAVVVVLIHAIATFAPQIRAIYESVEWWLWFVPVGIAVVVFAARFEKSVLRMRSVAMRIRALR